MRIDKCVSWVTGFCLAAIRPWLRLCAHRPRDLGAVARIRLREGGYCATRNTPPRARLLACAPYAALAPAMCSPPPRLGGRLRAYASAPMCPGPSSATDLSSKLALFRAFRTISPDAERDNRAQRTQFKEAPWDSISIEATRGLNLHYLARYNMSTNRVSSPT